MRIKSKTVVTLEKAGTIKGRLDSWSGMEPDNYWLATPFFVRVRNEERYLDEKLWVTVNLSADGLVYIDMDCGLTIDEKAVWLVQALTRFFRPIEKKLEQDMDRTSVDVARFGSRKLEKQFSKVEGFKEFWDKIKKEFEQHEFRVHYYYADKERKYQEQLAGQA